MAGILEAFLLCAVISWLFFKCGLQEMVDVVATRLQQLNIQWEQKWKPHHKLANVEAFRDQQKHSFASLRRYGYQERNRQRLAIRDNIRITLNRKQFLIKEVPWDITLSCKGRPFMGLCCSTCTPTSQQNYSKPAKFNNVRDILLANTAEYRNGFLSRNLCHLATVWNLKKYEYPYIYTSVLRDERLQQACGMAADQDMREMSQKSEDIYQKLVKKHEKRAAQILCNMCSTLSDFLLRLTSWVLYKLLPCFLTRIVAHPGQIQMLHLASRRGVPLIFLPLHRSHLDYILISFILLNNNIRSPLVAAGDNLNIPVFGWLLRGLGAFFIKRRIDPAVGRRDIIYRAVLHTYMIECLRAGHNMEFFIEGGRTRTGKPCFPKGGLLSVIVDAYMDGTIEDALLVPVSVNYEKLVDGNFVRELLGQPKQMETFTRAIRGIWKVLSSNYGTMRIDFNQPFSLRELVQSFQSLNKQKTKFFSDNIGDNTYNQYLSPSDGNANNLTIECNKNFHSAPSSTSLYGTDFVDEEHRLLVESIARHILFDASCSTAVMSTNAVAFLLLGKFRTGATVCQLVQEMDRLRDDLHLAERDTGFSGHSVDVINHALELLGPGLVRKDRRVVSLDGQSEPEPTVFIEPVTMLPNVIELYYYSSALLPFFAVEAAIGSSLCSLIKWECQSPQTKQISEEAIILRAYELCNILQFEFIFCKPCQMLENVIIDKLDNFKYKDILSQDIVCYTEEQERSRRLARYILPDDSSDEESYTKPTHYVVNLDAKSIEHLRYFEGLLRPLIDTYAISADVLSRLVGRQLLEKELVQEILAEIKTQIDLGHCFHEESLSVEPVKNSLKLFEHWGLLECHTQEKIKLYYLKEEFDSERQVQKIFDKIQKFRIIKR
ncbi:glycerol-3-phosphate acyltransferase 1, mitochondrial isoform X1 [Schistocerca cancellata]|uniref:glycerol-3-phosphate acyltransferase 1, mitochondrial isoform X1 n=2 Tax=Schistocerca cancellata TaxID=274614 RepID=UPI002118010D|nr:glycerol-3-phosphate acyltransferase 1, mitochondrial isoform X1 [Schistocerca cancellata]